MEIQQEMGKWTGKIEGNLCFIFDYWNGYFNEFFLLIGLLWDYEAFWVCNILLEGPNVL